MGLWVPQRRLVLPWGNQFAAHAAGERLLDEQGRWMLRGGKGVLSDGAGDECCCGCLHELLLCPGGESSGFGLPADRIPSGASHVKVGGLCYSIGECVAGLQEVGSEVAVASVSGCADGQCGAPTCSLCTTGVPAYFDVSLEDIGFEPNCCTRTIFNGNTWYHQWNGTTINATVRIPYVSNCLWFARFAYAELVNCTTERNGGSCTGPWLTTLVDPSTFITGGPNNPQITVQVQVGVSAMELRVGYQYYYESGQPEGPCGHSLTAFVRSWSVSGGNCKAIASLTNSLAGGCNLGSAPIGNGGTATVIGGP